MHIRLSSKQKQVAVHVLMVFAGTILASALASKNLTVSVLLSAATTAAVAVGHYLLGFFQTDATNPPSNT